MPYSESVAHLHLLAGDEMTRPGSAARQSSCSRGMPMFLQGSVSTGATKAGKKNPVIGVC